MYSIMLLSKWSGYRDYEERDAYYSLFQQEQQIMQIHLCLLPLFFSVHHRKSTHSLNCPLLHIYSILLTSCSPPDQKKSYVNKLVRV